MNGKMPSKTGPCPQLQVGGTSIRGCLMMTALKQAIGTAFALPIVLELSLTETPKNENLLIAAYHFWSNGVNALIFGHDQCPPLWPMYI
jgi:hypothetical protein